MPAIFRFRLPLGLLALCVVAAPVLLAAEESARDLMPILPTARSLTNNNNNPYQYRNYGNGSAQAMSADGKLLLMSSGNGLMLWNLDKRNSGQPRAFETGGINMYNIAITLSADGKMAAAVPVNYGGGDMAVRFFNTTTGKQVREIDNDEPICDLALAPDGRLLAIATRQRLELWNAENGEEVRVFSVSQAAMYRQLTYSPDGKMLAAIGNEPDTVHIWETASGKERGSVHFGAQTTPIAAGGRIAMRRMRMMVNGNNMNNGLLALAFSADNRMLAVSKTDSAIHLWDLRDDRELPPLTGFRGQVSAMVFTPDGKELIAMDSEVTRLSWRMARLRRNFNVRLAPLDDDDFAELWNDLAEPDSFRIYRARRHLSADPKRAVPLLSGRLEPVPAGNTARIQQLVKDLSSLNPGTRRKAMTELRTKHGEAALGALMQKTGVVNPGMAAMPPGMMMPNMAGANQATMQLMQKLLAQYNTPERQRDVLAVGILEEIGTPEARQTLSKLSKGAPGVGLTTASKTALDHLTAAVKERPRQATPEQLWTDLGSDDATRAFRAMCTLSATPQQTAMLLRKQLKPVPVVEDKEIAALLDNLSSDDFKVREQATESLSKIGEQALPAMKKALNGEVALEARKRLERLVEQTTSKASAPLLRGLRAIELMEHTATPESKHVLVALAGGAPQAQLTREAKASLERLTRR
ncbi:MAG: WD40 repeat domain-containing protein [Gemmataceae bacterium]